MGKEDEHEGGGAPLRDSAGRNSSTRETRKKKHSMCNMGEGRTGERDRKVIVEKADPLDTLAR